MMHINLNKIGLFQVKNIYILYIFELFYIVNLLYFIIKLF